MLTAASLPSHPLCAGSTNTHPPSDTKTISRPRQLSCGGKITPVKHALKKHCFQLIHKLQQCVSFQQTIKSQNFQNRKKP